MAAIRTRKSPSKRYLTRSGFQILDPQGRDVVKLALDHNFHVRKVASALGLKVFQLKAAIEHVVGMGPKEFFRHYRAVSARWMISEGMPLKDISNRLGFQYYTHFAAEIRSFYGMSPRGLKKIIEHRMPRSHPLSHMSIEPDSTSP